MKKTIQVECSAILGRKERLEAFRAFVAENRKTKGYRGLIAVFALKYGLRERLVKEYIDLLIHSGIYILWRGKLLTDQEYEKAIEEWEKEQKKKDEALKRRREGIRDGIISDDDFQPPEASVVESE